MADIHWHAYAWTGHERPPDSETRDVNAAVMPNDLNDWFRKPASLYHGVFVDVDTAYRWLADEVTPFTETPGGLPVSAHLAHACDCLERRADVYVGYYAAPGRLVVRTLLTCPRAGVVCPERP
ncbi:hypothetical protein [Streptomyces sp. GSL17-111]|uniref:hypothetical protein n=1 Tax=Streptomyces sp. GSL17-111 TaxID=3121596 RepID=UPI0030F3837C